MKFMSLISVTVKCVPCVSTLEFFGDVYYGRLNEYGPINAGLYGPDGIEAER